MHAYEVKRVIMGIKKAFGWVYRIPPETSFKNLCTLKNTFICLFYANFHRTTDLHQLKVHLKPFPKQVVNECDGGEFRQL